MPCQRLRCSCGGCSYAAPLALRCLAGVWGMQVTAPAWDTGSRTVRAAALNDAIVSPCVQPPCTCAD
jgi:hypothetical protein